MSVYFTNHQDGAFQRADWRKYWESLTPGQQAWIKDTCRRERMSASAVAIDYGAPLPDKVNDDGTLKGDAPCGT